MSTFYPYSLECACGHVHTVEVVEGIHITRLPKAREQILAGTFQVFACPGCGEATAVESSAVYTDFERFQYVAMESAANHNWQSAQVRHNTVFEDAVMSGPEIAREMGIKFTKRVVFGLRALREKLVLWDAGLDDYVVEALKGDLANELEVSHADVIFRIKTVLPGGHLMFARYEVVPRPDAPEGEPVKVVLPAPVDFETVPAAKYEARSRDRGRIATDYPWLQDDWFIDIHDGPSFLYT